jgi:hypothetical protein
LRRTGAVGHHSARTPNAVVFTMAWLVVILGAFRAPCRLIVEEPRGAEFWKHSYSGVVIISDWEKNHGMGKNWAWELNHAIFILCEELLKR